MSRGTTIAQFVQDVLYCMYKVRLETAYSDELPDAFHADTDKFKEIVMEGNFVIADLQKTMDWSWLRDRWNIGYAEALPDGRIMEFELPDTTYKICTGYNDAVRMHNPKDMNSFIEIPIVSARSGNTNTVAMFDQYGRHDVADNRLQAFLVANHLTFTRPFYPQEVGMLIETDIIEYLPDLHICDATCVQPCAKVYVDKVFEQIPDPYYMVVKTATKRAEGDPSIVDRVLSLTDESSKLLSTMRSNDSAKTTTDTYTTVELGFQRVF